MENKYPDNRLLSSIRQFGLIVESSIPAGLTIGIFSSTLFIICWTYTRLYFNSKFIRPGIDYKRPSIIRFTLGIVGATIAGASGILRAAPNPTIRAIAGGISYTIWGTTFWSARSYYVKHWLTHEPPTSSDRIRASTAAGCITGACAGTFSRYVGKSPNTILPSIVTWSLLAFSGQQTWEYVDKLREAQSTTSPSSPLWERLIRHPWFPVSMLSQEEYRNYLQEKLLSIDAEIEIIDEKISMTKESITNIESQMSSLQLSPNNPNKNEANDHPKS